VAYYDHRHSGIDETNILQVVKAVEGETIEILCLFPCVESQQFGPVITFSVDIGRLLHFTFIFVFLTVSEHLLVVDGPLLLASARVTFLDRGFNSAEPEPEFLLWRDS
jgi:hypothetical protein